MLRQRQGISYLCLLFFQTIYDAFKAITLTSIHLHQQLPPTMLRLSLFAWHLLVWPSITLT
ncbi:MAG: hypothetical protein AAFW00_19580 [Bacteroidota bacterium]